MNSRFYFFVVVFALSAFICQAQDDPRIAKYLEAKETIGSAEINKYLDELFPEWQLSKLRNLCTMVSGRMKDNMSDGNYKYLYQRRIYEAAKVNRAVDSKETIIRKISTMWSVAEQLKLLNCNSTQFDVMDGNLLKYAVSYRFSEFIDEAIFWKVPLNRIDITDDRTLLDYVQYHVNKNKGNALEGLYQIYYDKLRLAGAKHSTELLRKSD
jgi:hypothetical protein